MSRSLAIAHVLNIAAWTCVANAFLTIGVVGKPVCLGFVLSMPLFALSLWFNNAAAREKSRLL